VDPPILPSKYETTVDIIVDITNGAMTLIDAEGQQYTKKKID
jgi:hypothetical protein